MKSQTRRRFTQDQKKKYVADYSAAVAERKGQQWIEANGITASNIAAFRQSLNSKKTVSAAQSASEVAWQRPITQSTGRSSQTPNVERLRVGIELAVAELGGSVQWHRPA